MDILDRLFAPPPPAVKAIAPTMIGVQGRAPYPDADAESLVKAHRHSELAFACIAIKRKAMQDPRLVVQQKKGDTYEEVAGHPLRRLLMRPNPRMDEAAFTAAVVASMDIAGVFYAEKVLSGSRALVELWPLNPGCMRRKTTKAGEEYYEWREGRQKVDYKPEELLIRREADWYSPPPLEVALGAVDADKAQTDFIRAFFDNAGVPSGILKVKGTLDQPRADALKAKWRGWYGRYGQGQHDLAVLDDNADYQQIGSDLNKLDSETLRALSESRICMAFGVPPLIVYAYVGLLRATYSNLKEAWASFWDAELSPMLKAYRSWLTWSLLTEFASEEAIFAEQFRLHWDLSGVAALREDVDAAQTRARENFRAGTLTLNETRAILGAPADPAGDYYVRNLVFVPTQFGANAQAAQADVQETRSRRAPAARKAATVEQRMEAEIKTYLLQQYEQAAQAVLGGA